MTSEFDEIYSNFLGLIAGYEIAELSKKDAYALMEEWLMKTISRPKVRKLFSSISVDSDTEEVSYELRQPLDEDTDKLFVETLFANGMVIGWLSPRMKTELLVDQIYGTKEEKWFAQANHMSEVRQLYKKAETELDKDYTRDRGYSVFILNGVET